MQLTFLHAAQHFMNQAPFHSTFPISDWRIELLLLGREFSIRCLVVHLTLNFSFTFYLALRRQLQILTRLKIYYELEKAAVTLNIFVRCTTWHLKENFLKVSAYSIQPFRRSCGHKINKIANTKMHVSHQFDKFYANWSIS